MRFPWTKPAAAPEAVDLPTVEQAVNSLSAANTSGAEALAGLVATNPAPQPDAAPAQEATPMATDDFSDVHAALSPDSPATGDTVTVAITGVDHHTDTSDGTIGPLTLQLSAGGATTDLAVDAVPYTLVSHSDVDVVLFGVTDPSGRTWTVAADGKSATATA